jgi:hypothetical protein
MMKIKTAQIIGSVAIGALLFFVVHKTLHLESRDMGPEAPIAIISIEDFIEQARALGAKNPIDDGFRAARLAASDLAERGYIVLESQDVFEAHKSFHVTIKLDQ